MDESMDERRQRAVQILDRLEQEHPDARIYLDYETPLQLLVATILAAQCTDEKVNEVTPELFRRFPTAQDLAEADPAQIQQIVRPTGTFRRKTESVQRACRTIVEDYGGEVPQDIEALTDIKGVGRKTASVVVGNAFGQQAVFVDTHVKRVAMRLGLTERKTREAAEKELREVLPDDRWTRASQLLTTHGRRVCTAKDPAHEECVVKDLCRFYREEVQG